LGGGRLGRLSEERSSGSDASGVPSGGDCLCDEILGRLFLRDS
jgi:hypothetical protein